MMVIARLLRHPLLLGWLLGLATVAAGAAIVGGLVVFGGLYDTGARSPHAKPVAWAIHTTMIHSVERRAAKLPALPATASFWSGARNYEVHCLACHGGPGVDRAPWVKGMLPTPPFLVDASSHWSRRELYNILHDGVKMTGMPAWGDLYDAQQISDVVAFVQLLPKLTPQQFRTAMAKVRATSAPAAGSGEPAASGAGRVGKREAQTGAGIVSDKATRPSS